MPELVLDNLREIVLPASWLLDPGNNDVEAPYDPRYQVVKKLEPFLSRAQEVIQYIPVDSVRFFG